MKSLIILGLISLTFSTFIVNIHEFTCTCSDYSFSEKYCKKFYSCVWENNLCFYPKCDFYETSCIKNYNTDRTCKWDGTKCQVYIPDCSEFTNQEWCDTQLDMHHCHWLDGCKANLKCSDFVPTARYPCGVRKEFPKYQNYCTTSEDKTHCQDQPKTCPEITNNNECISILNQEFCIWNNTCEKFSDCSKLLTNHLCSLKDRFCIYDTTCRTRKCSDQTQENCTYIFSYSETMNLIANVCWWDTQTQKCSDLPDITYLTQYACSSYLGVDWDGSQCYQCKSPYSRYQDYSSFASDSISSGSNSTTSGSN